MAARRKQTVKDAGGVRKLHSRSCGARDLGDECGCGAGFQARITIPAAPGCGKSKRETKTFASRKSANRWLYEREAAVESGYRHDPASTQTLDQAVSNWFSMAGRGHLSTRRSTKPYKPSTIRGYEQLYRRHVKAKLGQRPVGSIRRKEIQQFVDRLATVPAERGGTLSGRTIRNTYNFMRVIFDHLASREMIETNPCDGVRLPACDQQDVEFLEIDELESLIDALDAADGALYATAGYGGLRLGEILALDWNSIDFDKGQIKVERSWDHKSKAFVDPKSKAGRRNVPLSTKLRERLVLHRAGLGSLPDGFELVFPGSHGRPQAPSSLEQRLGRQWTKAGLRVPKRRIHIARHTCASLLIAAGVSLKYISGILGHSTVSFTLDRYGHLFDEDLQHTATQLDSYLEGTRPGQLVGNNPAKA